MAVNYRWLLWTFAARRAGNQGNIQATAFELRLSGSSLAYDIPAARSTASAIFPTGSHTWRYLRFVVGETRDVNNSATQLNELQMTLSGSPVSWPVGSVATNPGGNNQDPAAGAIDGDTSGTKWGDGNLGANSFAILHIDTQTGITFDGFRFYTGNDAQSRDPFVFVLEGSDDDIDYTEIYMHTYTEGDPDTGSEWVNALLDEDDNTKWNAPNAVGAALLFEWNRAFTSGFDAYRYKTGNDDDNRDPVSWTLEGSNDLVDWDLLDTRTSETITTSRQTYTQDFAIAGGSPPDDEQPAAKRMGGVRFAQAGNQMW